VQGRGSEQHAIEYAASIAPAPPRRSARRLRSCSHSTKGFRYSHCISVRSAMPSVCANRLFTSDVGEIGSRANLVSKVNEHE